MQENSATGTVFLHIVSLDRFELIVTKNYEHLPSFFVILIDLTGFRYENANGPSPRKLSAQA